VSERRASTAGPPVYSVNLKPRPERGFSLNANGVHRPSQSSESSRPSEAGRNFYERAKRVIEEAEEAEVAARGAGAALSGRLRICAALTFARLHVIPRLPLFLAEHPALDVDVLLSDAPKDLIEGGIDVALRLGELTDSSMTAHKIGQSQRRVIGSPTYFEAMGVPQTPADLRSTKLSTP
jgi:DNA-binding transcriptional LysR family regulator